MSGQDEAHTAEIGRPPTARQRGVAEGLRQAQKVVADYLKNLDAFEAKMFRPETPLNAGRSEGARRAAEIINQRVTEARNKILHPERYEGGDDE